MASKKTNAFMETAQKSKREMECIGRRQTNTERAAERGLKVCSIRIPEDLHRKAQYHRIETGENLTQLIVRLLRDELG